MYVVKMTETVFKAPKMKKESAVEEDGVLASSSKRPRTAEDFYLFCTFILEYEKYGLHKQEELIEQDSSPVSSPESVEDCGRPELLNSSDQKDQKEPSESASPELASNQDWNWNGIHFSGAVPSHFPNCPEYLSDTTSAH
ncbi:uncharacterized protein [Anabrus simplex]|uniref:uncharacterized protein isoform X3 n=1 Tax=Anabrus simplex TaxID=316456 RepID=UPI0035A307E3